MDEGPVEIHKGDMSQNLENSSEKIILLQNKNRGCFSK